MCLYLLNDMVIYLSFTEEFVKFTVNYHVVLSPFLSAKVMYLLLHFRENSAQLLRVREDLDQCIFVTV